MLAAEKVILSQIQCDATAEDQVFLQATLKKEGKEGFDLVITNGSAVWEGSISEEDLDRQSTALKVDFDSYVSETIDAFKGASSANTTFECVFKQRNVASAHLLWKKVPERNIKYQLGNIDLKKSEKPGEMLCSVLLQCVASSQCMASQISALHTDNQRLAQDRQSAIKRLEKCVQAKDQLERDLYSKFVLVLNNKKDKIRKLEDILENGALEEEEENEATSSPEPSTSRSTNGAANLSSGTGLTTAVSNSKMHDQDRDDESTPPKRQKVQDPPQKLPVSEDSPLNLGDDEDECAGVAKRAPVVRKGRRQQAVKKETLSKPTLPRVSSNTASERNAGTSSRRSSLRKSGSSKSNKSSGDLDPDDLMDDF